MSGRYYTWLGVAAFLSVLLVGCDDFKLVDDDLNERRSGPDVPGTTVGTAENYAPGRVLALFKPGANAGAVAAAHGAEVQREVAFGILMLKVPDGAELTVAQALSRNPNVTFAEPDFIRTFGIPCKSGDGTCTGPNDPFFGYKWDLHNDGTIKSSTGEFQATTGKVDADMDWLEAYNHLGNASGTARLGILDTGIRNDHQEFTGRIVAQYDFHANRSSAEDDDGHGSHVAGIAAARGNDGKGVPGVAYNEGIELVIAKVCGPLSPPRFGQRYGCYSSSTAAGIEWAVNNGAHVLNISLGGSSASETEQTALKYARNNDVLPFCAAGNNSGSVSYPARFPECVAVSATNWSDQLASYSNYGPEIELSAPGGDSEHPDGYSYILSAYNNSATGYAFMAGTSMSSPQAAGLAALLHSQGVTGPNTILQRMKSTADNLGDASRFGAGRINVYNAVADVEPGEPSPPENQPPIASFTYSCEELSCTFTDTSTDSDGSVVAWQWSFGDGATSSQQHPSYTYGEDGTYTVTLTVTDDDGATDSASENVSVSSESEPPPPDGIVLTANAYKVRGIVHVDLSWTGSSAGSFDVFRNSTNIATVPGYSYTDNTGLRGGGSISYRVCEAGTSTCSSTVTVNY